MLLYAYHTNNPTRHRIRQPFHVSSRTVVTPSVGSYANIARIHSRILMASDAAKANRASQTHFPVGPLKGMSLRSREEPCF